MIGDHVDLRVPPGLQPADRPARGLEREVEVVDDLAAHTVTRRVDLAVKEHEKRRQAWRLLGEVEHIGDLVPGLPGRAGRKGPGTCRRDQLLAGRGETEIPS